MGILQDDVEGDVGSVPRCHTCHSERVVKDAWACWNPKTGLWELENVFDQEFCHQCEEETKIEWVRPEALPQQRIRELNDAFRSEGEGIGSVVVTVGLRDLGPDIVREAMLAIKEFNDFSNENDPWGEHDFGAIEIEGEKIFWKIDPYNLTLTAGSENPANETLTHRVLTIMLATEY